MSATAKRTRCCGECIKPDECAVGTIKFRCPRCDRVTGAVLEIVSASERPMDLHVDGMPEPARRVLKMDP